METHEHLPLQRSYEANLVKFMMRECSVQKPAFPWNNLIQWAANTWKEENAINTACKITLTATVHILWRKMNLWFQNFSNYNYAVQKQLYHVVRAKISSLKPHHTTCSMCYRGRVLASLVA